jgi:hypothetical protein
MFTSIASILPCLAQAAEEASTSRWVPFSGAAVVIVIAVAASRRRARQAAGGGLAISPLADANPPLKAGMLGRAETRIEKTGVARFGDQNFNVVNNGRPIEQREFVVLREIEDGQVVVLPKPLNSI